MKPQQPLTHALIAQKQPQFAALNTNKRTSTASSASSSSDTIVQVHHNEQFFKQHQVHLQKLKPKDDSAQIRAHDAQQKRMKKKDINKHSYKGSNRVMKENVDSGIKHKPVEGKIGSIQLIQKTKKQLDYKVKNQVFSSRDEQVESVHTNEDDNHERIVVQLITNNKVSQNQYYSHSSFDSRTLKVNTRQTSKDRTQLSIERMQQNFVNPSFSNPFLNSFDKKSEQGFITSNKPSLNSTLASQHPSIVPPRKTLKCSSISECLQVNQHQRHSSSNLNSYASNVSHKVMSPTTTVIEMPLEKILHQSMEESLEDARFPQSYNAKHLSANSSTLTKESIKTYFVKVTNNKPEMVKQPLTKLRKSELKSIEKKIKDLGRVIKGHQYSKQSSASKIFANQKLTRKNSELVLQNMNPYQLAANLNSMIISKQKRQSHQQYSQTNNLQALTQSQESLHNVPSKHTKIQPAMTSFIQDQQLHQPQHIQIVLDINKHKKHMSTSLDDQQIFEQLPQPHISPRFTKTNLHFKDSLLHQATKPSRFTLNSLNQSLRQTSNSPHQSRNFQKSSICMAGSIVSASLNLQKIEGSFKDMVANSSRMQHLTQTMNNNKAKQNMSVTKRHESSRGSSVKQQTQGRNTVGGTSLYTKNMTGTQLNFKSERTSTRALNQCEPSLKEATYERVQEVDQEYDSSRILNDKQPGTCALVQKCLSSCKSPAQFKKSLHYNQPKLIKRDRSYLIKVLFHVTKFFGIDALIRLAHCSKKFTKIREIKFIINSQFRTLIVRGLSTFDRAKYWNYRTRFVYYRRKYKNLYNKIIVEKKSEYQSDISKDLDRTFPQLKHFTKGNLGQDQLERLLTAISIYYKKLGYVQGMNFIVGTDAFWMIISMLVNFKLDQLLTFENNKFKILCYQIDMFVKAYLPHLYEIFKQNDLSSEFYASQWLFTFFSIDLPFDIVFIAIDLFLLEGYSALIRICLTLLKLIENELFDMSFDESLVYLKTFGRHLDTDIEHFFQIAMSFKISKQMLKDLEKYQVEEKSLNDVTFDYDNKKWVSMAEVQQPSITEMVKFKAEQMEKIEPGKDDELVHDLSSSQILNSGQKFNPINAIGTRVKKLIKWFKNDDIEAKILIEDDNHSDEVSETSQDRSCHRSADIDDQMPPLSSQIVTPQSQQIKTIKSSGKSSHQQPVQDFSSLLMHEKSINQSHQMIDFKEGPRLNLPNLNRIQQYHNKTKESKLSDKGHKIEDFPN